MSMLAGDKPKKKKLVSMSVMNAKTSWNSENNFGSSLMQKLGWSVGQGLGKDEQGNTAPIRPKSQIGSLGLGAKEESLAPQHFDKLENALADINNKCEGKSDKKKSNKIENFVHTSSLACKKKIPMNVNQLSEKDLKCIFGFMEKKESEKAAPQPAIMEEPTNSNCQFSTNPIKIEDYFSKKMKALKAKRQEGILASSEQDLDDMDQFPEVDFEVERTDFSFNVSGIKTPKAKRDKDNYTDKETGEQKKNLEQNDTSFSYEKDKKSKKRSKKKKTCEISVDNEDIPAMENDSEEVNNMSRKSKKFDNKSEAISINESKQKPRKSTEVKESDEAANSDSEDITIKKSKKKSKTTVIQSVKENEQSEGVRVKKAKKSKKSNENESQMEGEDEPCVKNICENDPLSDSNIVDETVSRKKSKKRKTSLINSDTDRTLENEGDKPKKNKNVPEISNVQEEEYEINDKTEVCRKKSIKSKCSPEQNITVVSQGENTLSETPRDLSSTEVVPDEKKNKKRKRKGSKAPDDKEETSSSSCSMISLQQDVVMENQNNANHESTSLPRKKIKTNLSESYLMATENLPIKSKLKAKKGLQQSLKNLFSSDNSEVRSESTFGDDSLDRYMPSTQVDGKHDIEKPVKKSVTLRAKKSFRNVRSEMETFFNKLSKTDQPTGDGKGKRKLDQISEDSETKRDDGSSKKRGHSQTAEATTSQTKCDEEIETVAESIFKGSNIESIVGYRL